MTSTHVWHGGLYPYPGLWYDRPRGYNGGVLTRWTVGEKLTDVVSDHFWYSKWYAKEERWTFTPASNS